MEDPETPGKIQMERFIPVESFRKKSNTFRGITFSPFLPKRPKFSVPFVWITSARLHVERKWKIYRYFVNVTTQSFSCFQCQKQYQCHLMAIFHEISVQMASAPCFDTNRPALLCKSCCFYAINWNFQSIISIRKRGQPHPHVYSKVRILIDCEQSLFFFRFSENNCTRAGAAKPRDERNEGGSPRRKKRDCPLSQSQWIKRWPHNAKYDWLICVALTTNCQQSKQLTSWWLLKYCQHFSFDAKKSLDRERPFSPALREVSLFSCLSRLAQLVTRVAICVSRVLLDGLQKTERLLVV